MSSVLRSGATSLHSSCTARRTLCRSKRLCLIPICRDSLVRFTRALYSLLLLLACQTEEWSIAANSCCRFVTQLHLYFKAISNCCSASMLVDKLTCCHACMMQAASCIKTLQLSARHLKQYCIKCLQRYMASDRPVQKGLVFVSKLSHLLRIGS